MRQTASDDDRTRRIADGDQADLADRSQIAERNVETDEGRYPDEADHKSADPPQVEATARAAVPGRLSCPGRGALGVAPRWRERAAPRLHGAGRVCETRRTRRGLRVAPLGALVPVALHAYPGRFLELRTPFRGPLVE